MQSDNVTGESKVEDIYMGFSADCDPVVHSSKSPLIFISDYEDAGVTPGMITDARILLCVRKGVGRVQGWLTIESRGVTTKYHYNIAFPEVRELQYLNCKWENETVHMRITHH